MCMACREGLYGGGGSDGLPAAGGISHLSAPATHASCNDVNIPAPGPDPVIPDND